MKGICPVCSAEYPIPDDKIQGKPRGLPVRCRQCTTVFRVYADGRPATVDQAAPKPPATAAAPTPPPTAAPTPPPAAALTPAPAAALTPAPPPKPAAPPQQPLPSAIKVDAASLEPTGRETTARRSIVRSTFINQATATGAESPAPEEKPIAAAPPPAPAPVPPPKPAPTAKPFAPRPAPATAAPPPFEARQGGKKKKKKKRHHQPGAPAATTSQPEAPPDETPSASEPNFDWAASERRPDTDFDDQSDLADELPPPDEPAFVAAEPKMPDFEKYADDSPFKRKPLFGKQNEFGEGESAAGGAAIGAKASAEPEDDFPYKKVVRAAWREAAKEKLPPLNGQESASKTWMKVFLVFAALAIVAATIVVIVMVRDQIIDYQANLAKRNEASSIQQEENRKKLDYRLKFQTALEELKPGTPAAYQKALELLDLSLAAKPDFNQAAAEKALLLALMAIEFDKTEGVGEACTLAQQAVDREAKAPYALRAMAACELAKDKPDEAEKTIHEAIVVKEGDDLEDAESNFLLAYVFLKKNDKGKAEFALQSSIAQNPLNFRAFHKLADVYASEKKWQPALEAEQKALALIGDSADAKRRIELYQSNLRGDMAQTGPVPGLPAEVGSDMDKKAKAKELMMRINQAEARGAHNEALGMVNELLKLGVLNGEAMLVKCRIMLNSNQYAAAVESCGGARSVNPDANYYLAAAYEAMGNKSAATESYQAYLNARPTGSHASEVRSILGLTGE